MYRRRRRKRPVILLFAVLAIAVGITVFFIMNSGILSYRKGIRAFHQNEYEKAAEYLKCAIEKKRDNAEYLIAYGMSLIETGDYENALSQFQAVISDKDSKTDAENNKKANRGMGICYFFAKNYENSIKYFDYALDIDALDDLDLDILKYKADALVYLGSYEEAVMIYNDIISRQDYSDDMYLKRAYALTQKGDVEDAVADYDCVIEHTKDNFDAYLGAYTLLMKAEEDEKADSYLEAALSVEPDTTQEKLKYAVIQYYFYGITDKAVASLEQLIQENEPEAYFYLAKISYAEEDFEQVSSYLNSYVSTGNVEHKAEAYEMLGRCAMLSDDYDTALTWFEIGITCNDAKWTQTLRKDQIAVYEHLSDFDTAYTLATEYLADFPDDQEIIRELQFIETRLSNRMVE